MEPSIQGFPGDSVVKNPPANAGDVSLIPWLPRSPGEGNDNPLQYSCLGNSMDRGAWWATVPGVPKESDMTEWLNNNNNCEKMLKSSFLVVYTTTGYRSWALRTQIVAPWNLGSDLASLISSVVLDGDFSVPQLLPLCNRLIIDLSYNIVVLAI